MVRSCLAVSMCLVVGGLVWADDEPLKIHEELPNVIFHASDEQQAQRDRERQKRDRELAKETATQWLLIDQDAGRWIRSYWKQVREQAGEAGKAVLDPGPADHGITGNIISATRIMKDDRPDPQWVSVQWMYDLPPESDGKYVVGLAMFAHAERFGAIPYYSHDTRIVYPTVATKPQGDAPAPISVPVTLPRWESRSAIEATVVVFLYDSRADELLVLDAAPMRVYVGVDPPGEKETQAD